MDKALAWAALCCVATACSGGPAQGPVEGTTAAGSDSGSTGGTTGAGSSESTVGQPVGCDCVDAFGVVDPMPCTGSTVKICGKVSVQCGAIDDDASCDVAAPSAAEVAVLDCMVTASDTGEVARISLSKEDPRGQNVRARWIVSLGDGTALAGGESVRGAGGTDDPVVFVSAPDAAAFVACRDAATVLAMHDCVADLSSAAEVMQTCGEE